MATTIGIILGIIFLIWAIPKGFATLGDAYKSGGIIGLIAVIALVFLIVGFGL